MELSFFARLSLAFAAFVKVLTDPAYASRVARAALPEPTAKIVEAKEPEPARKLTPVATPEAPAATDAGPALQLLALFQREGRLLDFLEQDVASFDDADVGAAARLVHEGCRKALRAHATIEPLRAEAEDAKVTLAPGFDARAVKLTGNVRGQAPYTGTLRHRGWRVRGLSLPTATPGHDASLVAPAEIELP